MEESFEKIKIIIKNLNKTMKYIHKKEGYLYTFLFFDIIWCYIRYGITYNEYRIFEFYNLDSDRRKTYISKRKYKKIRKKLVSDEIINVIEDKELFLRRFKDYINYDLRDINNMSFKDFENLAISNKKVIARSPNNSFLSSYKKYDIKDYRSPAFVLDDIKNKKLFIVSKDFKQNKKLSEIDDLVIVNIVSVVNGNNIDLVSSSIKFKDDNKIISGNINIKKNYITGHLKDMNGHDYDRIYNEFEIPYFNKVKDLCTCLARELEEIRQVEWSFIIGEDEKIYLIDANVWNDYIFSQTPEFLKNKIGLMAYYKKVI